MKLSFRRYIIQYGWLLLQTYFKAWIDVLSIYYVSFTHVYVTSELFITIYKSFITFNEKSFDQKNFWNRCRGTKLPKWLSGKKIATLPFWHFCPCALISKILLVKWLLVESYERPIELWHWQRHLSPMYHIRSK